MEQFRTNEETRRILGIFQKYVEAVPNGGEVAYYIVERDTGVKLTGKAPLDRIVFRNRCLLRQAFDPTG
jgi:hypothetical protein